MSSILDALNKSEAERRRTPPDLNTPPPIMATRPQKPRRSWLLPVVAVAALALAWFGGLFDFGGSDGDPEPVAATQTTPAPEPAPTAPTAPEANAEPAPVAEAAPKTERRLPGFGPRPPAAEAPATPAQPAPAAPAPVAPVATTPAATAPETPVADGRNPAVADPEPVAAAPDAPAAPGTAAPAPRDGGIPTINDLPFATRRTLPALTLTMHLYSTDPARRLVLINGVQARDGEELDGGVQIKAIRPDGVVIGFEDTEFLLPSHN